ncbi:MAG: hypothetical protein WB662_01225 [Methyloceanibacter sp.]
MTIRHLILAEREIREYMSDQDPLNQGLSRAHTIIRAKLREALDLIAEARVIRDRAENGGEDRGNLELL